MRETAVAVWETLHSLDYLHLVVITAAKNLTLFHILCTCVLYTIYIHIYIYVCACIYIYMYIYIYIIKRTVAPILTQFY